MRTCRPPQNEILKGTLDIKFRRTFVSGEAHGHTVAKIIEHTSRIHLEVQLGSLYSAPRLPEDRKWNSSPWGVSDNNRKAKLYRLPSDGRKQLGRESGHWLRSQLALAMGEECGAQ